MRWLALVLLSTGCLSSGDVTCPTATGDLICPANTVCRLVAVWPDPVEQPTETRCVSVADLTACEGKDEGTKCDPEGAATGGECHSGGCFEVRCGNHFKDANEACDDANEAFGDGCSVGCQSDETCGNGFLDPVVQSGPVDMPVFEALEQCDGGSRAPHDGCDFNCQAEAARWRERFIGVPQARAHATMAFDARNHVFVMFGGVLRDMGTTLTSDETWTGALRTCQPDSIPDSVPCMTWTRATPAMHPSPRFGQAMAYDAARGETMLFGGGDNSGTPTTFEDTWSWDGQTWRVLPVAVHPSQRLHARMVYDSRRQRIVLYGGQTLNPNENMLLTDTWEWDGSVWTEIPIAKHPGAQVSAAMAYDPVRGVTVLFGASNVVGVGSTWEWDGVEWLERDATPPPAREGAAFAFDPVLGMLVLFGGRDTLTPTLADTWTWDGVEWAERDLVVGSKRADAAYASDATGRFVISHGQNPVLLDDTQVWTGAAWQTSPKLNKPVNLNRQIAAFDAIRGRVVVRSRQETWEYDGAAWTRVTDDAVTGSASEGAMVFDEARRVVLLYGGDVQNQTFTWSGTAWSPRTTTTSPGTRNNAAMAYDASRARVLLFGGAGDDRTLWAWDGTEWSIAEVAPIPPRIRHVMGHDRVRDQLVVFGGRSTAAITIGDTWVLDGRTNTWREITGPGPVARSGAAIAWSHARQRLVLFGGSDAAGGELQDTWEWDGDGWVPLVIEPVLAPSTRVDHLLTTSPNGVYLINGSHTGVPVDDVWELRFEGNVPEDTCRDDRDWDGDGQAGCRDEDCRGFCAPLCTPAGGFDAGFPAMTCDPDVPGPRCGDGQRDPLENCRSCPEDFPEGCVPICGDFFCDPGETCLGDCS